ncbi:hypothetical protein [Muricoccus pecuniae]|uniref:Uncharacterized protein n=1 Tax=Muricoccus pecuniae TaxID=693023 RepID=A0A840XTH5_9PROT|nr:hypothetical protein [Roseomonas pecuniae]MBB5691998.1 hypothetical protein [Roseomonas pecuniae]
MAEEEGRARLPVHARMGLRFHVQEGTEAGTGVDDEIRQAAPPGSRIAQAEVEVPEALEERWMQGGEGRTFQASNLTGRARLRPARTLQIT